MRTVEKLVWDKFRTKLIVGATTIYLTEDELDQLCSTSKVEHYSKTHDRMVTIKVQQG